MAIIPVKHKRSNISGKVPTVNELPLGEIAINTADGILYLKTENDGIVSITAIQASNETIVLSGDVSGTGSSLINVTLASSGVTAGTYNNSATAITPITIDAKGRVTSTGAAVTITPAFSSITGKPTNLAGYGINDAQPLDSDLTAIAALTGTSGLLRKTAADTWSLDTNTYLTGNQTIVISGDASGSGATTISLTLANSGVSTGTYTKVTVDAKGRVTAGAFLTASDIPDLVASKITDFDTQVRTNRLDQMAVPTGSVSLNSQRITSLATPTSDSDAATKAYVDAVKQGLDIKDSVRAATTANIVLSGTQTVDGVALVAGDRVLVKDQVSASTNGIYVVAIGAWDRAHDANTSSKAHAGIFTFVAEGTVNADSGWVLTTNDPITLGTTALTFTQFSGAGQITAGDGLTKSGNTLNVVGTSGRIVANADSIDLASNVIGTTGTYRSVTVDTYGRVTAGTNPTTLAAYGITDAQPLDADLTAIAGLAGTTGLLRKTAADSWSLDTNSYLTGNQSISISGDASGSGATSISLTLANSGVTAGTYNNSATSVTPITVDAKGRITGVGTAVTITPAFSSVTGKPTNLAGYGITDAATSTHTHGNITNAGAIGSTANLPIITTTSGVLTTGSFGNTANTFCQGNDARLSDTRNTTNSLTFNNGGAGSASGTAFNGSSAVTVSYNTVGAPSTTGANASGNWGINITGSSASCTGNAATATTATNLSGFTNSNSGSPISGADALTNNGLAYVTNISLYSQTDGALYTQAYSTQWIHQIYGDYRTGQIAVRGKQSNAWQNWRAVLDSGNYTSYAPSLTGTGASGTWGINVTGSSASSPLLSGLGSYVWLASTLPSGYNMGIQSSFVQGADGWHSYGSVLTMKTYSGGGGSLQMYVPYSPTYGGTGLQVRFGNYDTSSGNSWTGWKTLLASDNYNSYSPTLTGTGASGTWAINITGDASTLDGLDSNRFMRSSGHPGYDNWNTFGNAQQTVYEIYQENFNVPYNTGSSNFPTNRGYSYGTLINFGANSAARAQVYISHAGNDLIFRGGWGTDSWQTWNRVWTDINDGPGTGLNADLLDDLHATSFLRTDVDFPTLSRTGANYPQFITENTTNDATASYHIFKKTRASGALVNGDTLGTILFQGNVATNNTVNTNGYLTVNVNGSPNAGTGYLPVAVNIGSGERLRMDFANTGTMFELNNAGNCGIAGVSQSNETLRIGRKITGNTGSSSGFVNYGSPDVTGDNNMYLSYPVWQANKAVGPTIGYRAANAARATGATAATHFGFYCDNIISGQNGTWGFYSNISEEAGYFRRNFYADGNAPNYFRGNVGIGEQASPSWPLEVQKSLNGEALVQIANVNAGASAVAGIRLLGTSSRFLDLKIAAASSFGILNGSGITSLYYDIDTHIWRNNAGTERGRFTSGGFFKASNTSSYLNSTGTFHELRSNTSNSVALYLSHVGTSGTQYGALIETANDQNDATRYFLSCYGSTTQRATIRSNGGFANYQALDVNLSDINTKKDISPIAETWNCVKEWEIVNYRYKDQPEEAILNVGVIAQQVAESCPEVVTIFQEAEDETDEKPAKEELLGVKEQQMYWMAIKTLQEAQARIEALEAKVAALEKQ